MERTKEALERAGGICFDVDSTVCPHEGIDYLAAHCGAADEVAAWTKKAMEGGVSFRESLVARLNIIKPSKHQVESFLAKNPPSLTPGVREFIELLQAKQKKVFLVSGGFRELIEPVANELKIPNQNVYANQLFFHEESGEYAGFDESQPTSESGGKSVVVSLVQEKYSLGEVVMIGDGVTDLEARPPASYFIGFGGNVAREKVKEGADHFVYHFDELSALLR